MCTFNQVRKCFGIPPDEMYPINVICSFIYPIVWSCLLIYSLAHCIFFKVYSSIMSWWTFSTQKFPKQSGRSVAIYTSKHSLVNIFIFILSFWSLILYMPRNHHFAQWESTLKLDVRRSVCLPHSKFLIWSLKNTMLSAADWVVNTIYLSAFFFLKAWEIKYRWHIYLSHYNLIC